MTGATSTVMRLRRPRWRDPRLIVGIVLVLASVLGTSLLVARLAATTTVLVARQDIVVGDVLDTDLLTTAEIRLGERTALYARSFDQVPEGAVASSTVRAGELLPVSAIGQSQDVPLRPVVIPVDSSVAESVAPGGRVELWNTPEPGSDGADVHATVLVRDGVVRAVDTGSSLGMRSMTVEVLVPEDQVAPVLEALARGDRLDVIGVPGASGVGP